MKKEHELWAKLAELERDERIHYRPAEVAINAPLALEQVSLVARANQLRWIIGIPLRRYGQETKKEQTQLNVKISMGKRK